MPIHFVPTLVIFGEEKQFKQSVQVVPNVFGIKIVRTSDFCGISGCRSSNRTLRATTTLFPATRAC
jgi:hypothetical protein